jgi:hypothetical protein
VAVILIYQEELQALVAVLVDIGALFLESYLVKILLLNPLYHLLLDFHTL